MNGADERGCSSFCSNQQYHVKVTVLPPALADLDGWGNFILRPISQDPGMVLVEGAQCPESYFQCPDILYYCLPTYLRCNDVQDCLGQEDEASCEDYTCPASYRCRHSRTCLHPTHLCDGIAQCPQHDDELFCHLTCPAQCTCYGWAFFCHRPFRMDNASELRFLDASGSSMRPDDLLSMTMLVYLSMENCGLYDTKQLHFPNLWFLHLGHNKLSAIHSHSLAHMPQLLVLHLNGNPLISVFETNGNPATSMFETNRNPLTSVSGRNCDFIHSSLISLDLSNIPMNSFDGSVLKCFPSVTLVNLSANGIVEFTAGLEGLHHLEVLDLRGNPLTLFPRQLYHQQRSLKTVYADNYKLCCQATLPDGFNSNNCHAPFDEISSCEALLRSDVYRVVLAVFTCLCLLGNGTSLVFRLCVDRNNTHSYGVYVLHLAVSDLLMGIYLALIGLADRLYQGTYLWNDLTWRASSMCMVAGILSLLSSEVSAFNICLITLDRFLVLRFPFSQLHFGPRSAHMACGIAWTLGFLLALIPVLPMTSHWRFYQQKGICIPLPVTRSEFVGHDYSFGVMVLLNFVLFILIAVGQAFIYWSVRVNSVGDGQSTRKCKDLTIARRLISIAISDFFCWFPIGLLGLLAAHHVPIASTVNVAMALLVLPFNATLNPFIYTLNVLLDRRQRTQQQRLQYVLTAKVNAKVAEVMTNKTNFTFTKEEAGKVLRVWVTNGLVSLDQIQNNTQKE